MKQVMSFERFKEAMEAIETHQQKCRKIATFLEDELMEDSWCLITLGSNLVSSMINILADSFDCWFEWPNGSKSNDIEWWFYEAPDEEKKLTVNDEEMDVSSFENFYNYLVKEQERKNG